MVAGRSDDGIMITLSDPKKVDFQTAMLEDLLMRNGIDPQLIKTEDELKNIINQIEAVNKQRLQQAESGIRNTESAKVFNIEGQQLDPNKPIMGGTQTGKELSPELSDRLRGTNTERIKQKIADKKVRTEEDIKADLEAQNKDSVQRILERKNREDVYGLEDYDTTNMSDLKKELIRTETKLGNLNPDSPNFRERAKPLVDKIEAIQKKMKGGETSSSTLDQQIKNEYDKAVKEGKFKNIRLKDGRRIKSEDDFREYIDELNEDNDFDFATGGRVGLKAGMSRRAFLALMGSAGAGIGAAKTGLLKLFGQGAGKQVTKEIVKTPPVPGKPEWFDSLVNKVITQGEDVTKKFATKERQDVHKLQIDEMDDVTVYRNLDDGQIRVSYDSPNNMGEQPVDLVFKPGKGQTDEVTGKVADEFYAVEVEPRGVRTGPDDFDIEFDGENLASSVDELISDTSKLKQVATDKKPTMKEFIESKNKKDKTRAINEDQVEQAEYLETKYGPGPEGPEDFASGGIARMLGE